MNKKKYTFIFILLLFVSNIIAQDSWYKIYAEGTRAFNFKKYEEAIVHYQNALKLQNTDVKRIRTYGMHFIEYYPNREIGIAYYNLGDKKKALYHLNLSMKMEPSSRAQEYINLINGPESTTLIAPEPEPELIIAKQTIKLVGERMGIAVLPFENKGASNDLGEIILDKLITALFNQNRFKVIERSQLDKILIEQELGQSGVLDASTAAELGKGIGVDAIIIGSVAATRSGSISIDARAIDTESATIIVAHDAYSNTADVISVKNTIDELARKFTQSLPLVEGTVIQVNNDNTILLDGGRHAGLKKGLKCVIYKEGPELKHPISGEVLGKKTIILGEVLVIESLDKFATAKLIDSSAGISMSMGDKFLTK
jgi:TolB-like protein